MTPKLLDLFDENAHGGVAAADLLGLAEDGVGSIRVSEREERPCEVEARADREPRDGMPDDDAESLCPDGIGRRLMQRATPRGDPRRHRIDCHPSRPLGNAALDDDRAGLAREGLCRGPVATLYGQRGTEHESDDC